MSRARDSQRSKYWKATALMNGIERKLTEGETRRMLESIRSRVFLARRYPNVRLDRPFSYALSGGRLKAKNFHVNIPKCHHTDWSVASTAARMIFYRCDPYAQQAWYGWEFCAILVDVVHALMGRAASDMLIQSMRANGVRWKPKATRTVTLEMLARLADARSRAKEMV